MFKIIVAIIILLCVFGTTVFFVLRFIFEHNFKNKMDMETIKKKFTQSITFKGITIGILILLLLIPGAMIQDLIRERQDRSQETIQKISDKWSKSQTLCAPILIVPYTTTKLDKDQKPFEEEHILYLTPKDLKITTKLIPEERHYGIYKAILYKSELHFEGAFDELTRIKIENSVLHYDKAQMAIGVTDLRGVVENPDITIGNKKMETTIGVVPFFTVTENVIENGANSYGSRESYVTSNNVSGKTLIVNLKELNIADSLTDKLTFSCNMKLNGSSSINFIPIGQNTHVTLNGDWKSPSFIGSFSPESTIEKNQFSAQWNILSFNREIPEYWSDSNVSDLGATSFGVNLIETVDHYQQNMRSAKYALMFIALTFIVFFFVEIFTKKPIQFFQYLLVGIALTLFYSLLLSLSEQIGFGWAYVIASAATILLTTTYFYSLIKQKMATFVLTGIMSFLYAFLYIILQVEDYALLFGTIFLFVILGVIMFVSNKINHKKQASEGNDELG